MNRTLTSNFIIYTVVIISVAIVINILTLINIWTSPSIDGASTHYNYSALGWRKINGIKKFSYSMNGATIISTYYYGGHVLPKDWTIGLAKSSDVFLGPSVNKSQARICTEFLAGRYLQGFHLSHIEGRLISIRDQMTVLRPVVVISSTLAKRMFGAAGKALGEFLYTPHGIAVKVIGIIPSDFQGVSSCSSGQRPQAWMPFPSRYLVVHGQWPWLKGHPPKSLTSPYFEFIGPAPLLSAPKNISQSEVRSRLAFIYKKLISSNFNTIGYTTYSPYTQYPLAHQANLRHIYLFFATAIAMLFLAMLNMVVMKWLDWTRRYPRLALERILGASRSYFLRRFILQTSVTFLWMLPISLLVSLGLMEILRHLSVSLAPVLNISQLWLPTLAWLPLLLLAVLIMQALPIGWLLAREHLDTGLTRTVSSRGSEKVFRISLLVLEIFLASIMSILTGWILLYAIQAQYGSLGFLDHPVTLLNINSSTTSIARFNGVKDNPVQSHLWLHEIIQAAQTVAPGAVVGVGPRLGKYAFLASEKQVRSDQRRVSSCRLFLTPGWLQAVGARFLAGSNLISDSSGSTGVLLDARLASKLFGQPHGAVGRVVKVSAHSLGGPHSVLGVIAPMALAGLEGGSRCPTVIFNLRSVPYAVWQLGATVAVGRQLSPDQRKALSRRVLTILHNLHTGLKVGAVRTGDQVRHWLSASTTLQARILGMAAIFAWWLALSGELAMLRTYLAMRKRLSAIRSALGARPSRLYREVVLGVLALAGVGGGLALLVVPWLATQFTFLSGAQVSPFGLPTWIALAVLLLAVFLVAHFPARRAARAEPAQSLHEL